jgi:2-keto-4-pentenoate hydratase/2-oxohepta-3-ene-1,7-dioic acid hydratase in catechol pathway
VENDRKSDVKLKIYSVEDVDIRTPVVPSRIIRLRGCYERDITDTGFDPNIEKYDLNEREYPSMWISPSSSLSGHGDSVAIPPKINDVRGGSELALVFSKGGSQISTDECFSYIGGCTAAISLSTYDSVPGIDGYTMYDGFLPLGPEINPIKKTKIKSSPMILEINDSIEDVWTTADWRFSLEEMISFVSHVMTICPGDILLTGDPTRTQKTLTADDTVTTTIDGVGKLSIKIRN